MRKKKRQILLLEVLIAFTLVVLCALPLITPHVFVIVEQKAFIREIQLDHFVNAHFAELTEKLYKNEVPWETISNGRSVPVETNLPFKGSYQFKEIKYKPKKKGPFTLYLFEVTYTFNSFKYPYNVFIVRDMPGEPEDEEEE